MQNKLPLLITGIGILVWLVWAAQGLLAAWQQHSLLALLIAVQAGLILSLLIVRRTVHEHGGVAAEPPWLQRVFAWAATLSPALLQTGNETLAVDVVAGCGLLLSFWALVALGKSFGVAPADRGLVVSGPYRYVRHPMYLGQFISVVGVVIETMSPWNVAILILIAATLLVRIHWEEQRIAGYPDYAGRVRWRLIPGLW